MKKLVKHVDRRIPKMMRGQAGRLDITLIKFFEYLVRQFEATYKRNSQEKSRKIVADVLATDAKGDATSPKMLDAKKSILLMFSGYTSFMDCGGQAEFLRYLVLQHKIYEDSMDFEDLKNIVKSYV